MLAAKVRESGRAAFPGEAFRGEAKAIAQADGYLMDNPLENVRLFGASAFKFRARNLPNFGALVRNSRSAVSRVIQHDPFANNRPGLCHTNQDILAQLTVEKVDLSFHHESEPLARSGLAEEDVCRTIHNRGAPAEDSCEFIWLNADPFSGLRDGMRVQFHRAVQEV